MEYIYSALLLHKAGMQISEDTVKKVLQSAGVKVDEARVKALVASLEGVDIDKAIESQAVLHASAAPSHHEKEPKKEEKKEQQKPEDEKKQEEAASAGLSALFG